ncbi:MAG TPA: response regulator [Pyrinomonadaceae bacterium]|nr:response regulator [Pyrinomonadaceae bacterium]
MNTLPPIITTELDVSPIILVVEDVHETRDGIEKLLIADGYRVALARDERDAIENAHRTQPDLILVSLAGLPLDVVLSARSIRQRAEVGEHVPVVVFCIEGIAEGEEVEIGENVFLTRPDNFNQLRRFIARLLIKVQTPPRIEVIQPPPNRISSP